VAALAVRGHLTLPADRPDAQPSAAWQEIQKLSTSGPPASWMIPHDDHPILARPSSPQQNAVTTQIQSPVLVALYDILGLWFTVPFCPIPPPLSQQFYICTHLSSLCIANIPGHHNLYHWLLAFQQLFQNMAWNWWRFQNGIPQLKQGACFLHC